MRTFRVALLAGVAGVALGLAGAASAQSSDTHVMTVRLPDGGLAQIRYTGNVAPQVSFDRSALPIDVFAPVPSLFGANSPFAQFERISAEMDRQAAAMFGQADMLAAQARSGQLTQTAMQSLPPGSQSYTVVSTMSDNGVCSRSVEITSQGNGTAPHVVSHSSGNCAPSGGAAGSVNLPTATPQTLQPGPVWTSAPAYTPVSPAPAAHPDLVWTSAHGAKPSAGLVEPIPPAQR